MGKLDWKSYESNLVPSWRNNCYILPYKFFSQCVHKKHCKFFLHRLIRSKYCFLYATRNKSRNQNFISHFFSACTTIFLWGTRRHMKEIDLRAKLEQKKRDSCVEKNILINDVIKNISFSSLVELKRGFVTKGTTMKLTRKSVENPMKILH